MLSHNSFTVLTKVTPSSDQSVLILPHVVMKLLKALMYQSASYEPFSLQYWQSNLLYKRIMIHLFLAQKERILLWLIVQNGEWWITGNAFLGNILLTQFTSNFAAWNIYIYIYIYINFQMTEVAMSIQN